MAVELHCPLHSVSSFAAHDASKWGKPPRLWNPAGHEPQDVNVPVFGAHTVWFSTQVFSRSTDRFPRALAYPR